MQKKNQPERALDSNLTVFIQQSLTQDLTEDQREEFILELAQRSKTEFEKTFVNLTTKLLPSIPPLHTLSHFAFYDLIFMASMRMNFPEKVSEEDDTRPLEQAHLELLQALLLRIEPDQFPECSPINYPQIIEEIREELRSLYLTWSLSRMADMKEDPQKGLASEFFRMRTAVIRNWGHTRQVFDWLLELFQPHDKELLTTYGITFTNIILAVKEILNLVQKRINEMQRLFRPVATARTTQQLLRAYIDLNKPTAEEITALQESDFDFESLKKYIIFHSDTFLHSIFTLHEEDLISISSADAAPRLKSIFLKWTTPLGSLQLTPRDHLMMANPVSTAPIIEIEDQRFFWPLIFVFQSFGLEMLASLLSNKSQDRFVKRTKPKFCETKVEKILRKAFPGSMIIANSQYDHSGSSFENDCIVILDAFCLVIEVKSGRLRPSAHRGSLDSLREGLNDIISEGSQQALRTLDALKSGATFRDVNNNEIAIDTASISEWISIVVTFEHLGEFSTNKSEAIKTGLLPEFTKECICINVADLEILMDILPDRPQRLHYLSRRISIEKNFKFRGDEIELLTFYLRTGFAIGQAEYDQEELLLLTGDSREIEPYLLKVSDDIPRPTRYLTMKWKSLLKEIESRSAKNWTLAVCSLLDHDRAAMDMLNEKLPKIYIEALSRKPDAIKKDTLILSGGPEQRKRTIIFIAGRNSTSPERRKRAMDAYTQASEDENCSLFMVFYIDLANPFMPYHSLYFMRTSDN